MRKGTGAVSISDFSSKVEGCKQQFYVWGVINYDDGFGVKRYTKFCHRYDCSGVTPQADGTYTIAEKYGRHHEYGNDAD